jgi:hypothetical protein
MRGNKLDAAFQRSEWWRTVMFGLLLALVAGFALLGTGIGNPLREVVGFACGALSLGFALSFVMTAFTSARFRRATTRQQHRQPSQPKTRMSRHDKIAYLFAFGLAATVGIAYFLSWRSVLWAWPVFVTVYLVLTGGFLLWRRTRT